MTNFGQEVAANVRAEMARQRIPQVKLAEALGTTQQSVSTRLRGSVEFTVGEIDVVARLLGLPIASLLPDNALVASKAAS